MNNPDALYRMSVYLKGDNLNPKDLTDRLSAEPTQAHHKGDKWLTSSGREVVEKTGLWALSVRASEDLSRVLSELASRLTKNGAALSKLPGVEEAYLDVFVAADADEDGGGTSEFDMDEKCIAALGKLGLPVRFTVAVVRE